MNNNNLENGNSDEHRKDFVSIIVNDVQRSIHRGKQTVVEIKTIGVVPLNHMLEQIMEGKFIPLDDNGSVVIKGDEVFISHIKEGGSA